MIAARNASIAASMRAISSAVNTSAMVSGG